VALERPCVVTGMEAIVARDSGAAIAERRAGIIDQIDATRHSRARDRGGGAAKLGVDIYRPS